MTQSETLEMRRIPGYPNEKLEIAVIRSLLFALVFAGISPAFADINVVAVYEGQARYLDAARANPSANLEELAQKNIVDSYLDSCSESLDSDERSLIQTILGRPISNLDGLANVLDEFAKTDPAAIAAIVARQAANVLPKSMDLTYCLIAWDPDRVESFQIYEDFNSSVVGQFESPSTVWLQIYPHDGWQELLKYTVAHEYHHFVRDGTESETLLEIMITEGLADAFVVHLYEGWTPPVFLPTSIDESIESNVWEEMQPYLNSTDDEILNRYLFGSLYGADDLPPVPGYGIGRNIALLFLDNAPNISTRVWASMPAGEVLRLSQYGN